MVHLMKDQAAVCDAKYYGARALNRSLLYVTCPACQRLATDEDREQAVADDRHVRSFFHRTMQTVGEN